MKRLTFAAAGAAVVGLAACGHVSVLSSASATSSAVTQSAAQVTCKQQYDGWKQGPGNGLVEAVSAVGSAGAAGGASVLTTVLSKAKPAVAKAAHNPMPACADPKGYWEVLLMHVNAAADSKGSAASLKAAMNNVPMIANELLAELKQTDG
jgi:hypothetical protein